MKEQLLVTFKEKDYAAGTGSELDETSLEKRLSRLDKAVETFTTTRYPYVSEVEQLGYVARLLPTETIETASDQAGSDALREIINNAQSAIEVERYALQQKVFHTDHDTHIDPDKRLKINQRLVSELLASGNITDSQKRIQTLRRLLLRSGLQEQINNIYLLSALNEEVDYLDNISEMAARPTQQPIKIPLLYPLAFNNGDDECEGFYELRAHEFTDGHDKLVSKEASLIFKEIYEIGSQLVPLDGKIASSEDILKLILDQKTLDVLIKLQTVHSAVYDSARKLLLDHYNEVNDDSIANYNSPIKQLLTSKYNTEQLLGSLNNEILNLMEKQLKKDLANLSFSEILNRYEQIGSTISDASSEQMKNLRKTLMEKITTTRSWRRTIEPNEGIKNILIAKAFGLESELFNAWKKGDYKVHFSQNYTNLESLTNLVNFMGQRVSTDELIEKLKPEQLSELIDMYIRITQDPYNSLDFSQCKTGADALFTKLTYSTNKPKRKAFLDTIKQLLDNIDIRTQVKDLNDWAIKILDNPNHDLNRFALSLLGEASPETQTQVREILIAKIDRISTIDDFITLMDYFKCFKQPVLNSRQIEMFKEKMKNNPEAISAGVRIILKLNILGVSREINDLLTDIEDPEFINFSAQIDKFPIDNELKNNLLLDISYFFSKNETHKLSILEKLFESGNTDLIKRTLTALRRVEENQLDFVLPENFENILTAIETVADRNMEKFDVDFGNLNYSWNVFYERFYNNSNVLRKLFREKLQLKTRKLYDHGSSPIIVPQGLSKIRRDGSDSHRPKPYVPSLAKYIYSAATENFSMYEIVSLEEEYYKSSGIDLRHLISDGAYKNDMKIAKNLWEHVLTKANDSSQRPFILWLNESTAPRYFGRDEVDAGFADAQHIAQGIHDREALNFLQQQKDRLNAVANKIRGNKQLTEDDNDFIESIKTVFKMSDLTRVLPLHEIKVKSGRNAHNIGLTFGVMENVANLAEILGMDILFVDVSSNPIGRSQQNIRSFMSSRGMKATEDGILKIQQHDLQYPDYSGYVLDNGKKTFKNSKVTLINFDPNDNRTRANADDESGFTVREGIGEDGIYNHTEESFIYIKPGGGFETYETYWRKIMTEAIPGYVTAHPRRKLRFVKN